MSEETKRNLEAAVAQVEECERQLELRKAECLEGIAAGLPEQLDARAKATALAQPDVTRTLGKDGVTQLRADLARAAEALGADLRVASAKIHWPEGPSRFDITVPKVESALAEYLKTRLGGIVEVFRRNGYDTHVGPRGGQWLVYPQHLYGDKGAVFSPVVSALSDLLTARQAHRLAKAADDNDVVSDIWGEGPEPTPRSGGGLVDW